MLEGFCSLRSSSRMFEAIHPSRSSLIDIPAYLREFGRIPLGHKGPDPRQPARCPYCKQSLGIVGGKTESTSGHFSHKRNSGFCPSKLPAGRPYLDLAPRIPNPLEALALKREFRMHWQLHYRKLEDLIPRLHLDEFLELLCLAERYRIWEYARLIEGHIPYVFLTLADFSPKSGRRDAKGNPERRLWLRFLYDSTVAHVEDLWIRPAAPPELYRVSYVPPARGVPGPKHLLKNTPLAIDTTFLSATPPPIPPYVIGKVDSWFAANWPMV